MRRFLVCVFMVTVVGLARQARGQGQPGSQGNDAEPSPPQLSREQTVAPSQTESDEAQRKTEQRRAALAGMVILTLLLVVFLLALMLLTAYWRRRRLPSRERRKPTQLKDLWWEVKEETLPEVDIERIMSENGEAEKGPPPGDDPERE
ncbi:MAG: hypothetical protein KAX80_11755 [Planctomycetes bacterium]|nr:hypothetical protein [Planctomycetota bacterium]